MKSSNYLVIQRAIDIFVSVVLAPIALVLCLIFGLIFYILTKNNPVFSQRRIGRDKKEFTIYKLRTMEQQTKNLPTHEIDRKSLSNIGKLMRAIKVDELPQLINVLRGEMSIVGPRPCLPLQSMLINERAERGVYDVLPGITGYAQLKGIDMSDPAALALADQFYIKHRSIAFDAKIMISTIVGKGIGDKTISKC